MKTSLSKGVLGLCLGAMLGCPPAAVADGIRGAGSSAAAPAYRLWADEYLKAGGEALDYDPVGSGAGRAAVSAGAVPVSGSKYLAATSVRPLPSAKHASARKVRPPIGGAPAQRF